MSDFEEIFRTYASLDKSAIYGYLLAKLDTVNRAIGQHPEVKSIFGGFMQGTIFADGVMDKNELTLTVDLCRRYRGNIPEDRIKEGMEAAKGADPMQYFDVFKGLPEYLRDDIVTACLIIANIDGKLSDQEIEFLERISF